MFKKILIANRGEIAVRVIRTCREMGIAAVAVYSDADRRAAHVLAADESVHIGPSDPSRSYLDADKLIAAAQATGAEAIHPGYGFLSENADFADRCRKGGIAFIGPPVSAIRDLGNKTTARSMMHQAGIPVIPGIHPVETDADRLREETERIGYPVVIKAAAGGGGKGMRIVHSGAEMPDALLSAASEAKNAFGDGSVYIEKFLKTPRHVEFQVLADAHGSVIHLPERECSIQRRHQKIIEESPSPVMTPDLREKMGRTAVTIAQIAGYVNAGTVEFLLDRDGRFYFLEVNTRLQVEHPVTEMVTGIDLVREQIRIAAGERLSMTQEDMAGRGHAIECRIYAEDPENGFMPSPGKISFLKEPAGPGVRNDCGVYSGWEVPVEYDPILSKLVVHAPDRSQAVRRMECALKDYAILGIRTPIPFLIDVLKSEAFRCGDTFTDLIETHFTGWRPPSDHRHVAAIAYAVHRAAARPHDRFDPGDATSPPSPWSTLGLFRP